MAIESLQFENIPLKDLKIIAYSVVHKIRAVEFVGEAKERELEIAHSRLWNLVNCSDVTTLSPEIVAQIVDSLNKLAVRFPNAF